MLRRLLIFTLFLALAVTPALAQDDGIRIDFPPPVYDVAGTFTVFGTVNPPSGLNSYFFEMGSYPEASIWTPVSLPSRTPVTGGALATINTSIVADGIYSLRLRVLLTNGESRSVIVAPLRVANTLNRLDGSAPPLVVAPQTTEPQVPPTPEPPRIVPRPNVISELPVPVGGQMDTFDENAATLMRQAGMTWMKWQIPFVVGDRSLIDVARDRINWSHEQGFFAFLSIKGLKDELAAGGLEYVDQYAAFVGELAALQPDAIQVWNEMNLDREWPQGQIDPRAYVELLRAAYEAIKAVDPIVKVVTGAPSPTGAEGAFGLDRVWNDDRYYLGMANAGAAQYSDCIGIHYNEGIISPRLQGGDPRGDYPTYYFPLMLQRAAFPFRSANPPLCFSEMGYLSPDGYGQLPDGFAWGANTSVAEQAEWLRDAIEIAATTANVDLIIVFNVNFTRFVDGDPQGGYAIIRPDGSCPACDSIAQLRSAG
ncbi:MAG: hypothetical protein L6Q98_07445 [Anaerolineae bacterium]|nr:hypothetical protein [Anaerolineae bacterium]NUQ04661.1 hypothetical protein [Anaerolineae bacterium]